MSFDEVWIYFITKHVRECTIYVHVRQHDIILLHCFQVKNLVQLHLITPIEI